VSEFDEERHVALTVGDAMRLAGILGRLIEEGEGGDEEAELVDAVLGPWSLEELIGIERAAYEAQDEEMRLALFPMAAGVNAWINAKTDDEEQAIEGLALARSMWPELYPHLLMIWRGDGPEDQAELATGVGVAAKRLGLEE